jgi:hypothetical protein
VSGRLLVLTFVLFVAFAHSGAAEERPPYLEHAIEVESRRSGAVWGRIDGDERLDLLVGNDSELRVWLQGSDGRYVEPIVTDLGTEVGGGIFDTTDLDGDGRLEVVIVHSRSVDSWSWSDEQMRLVRSKEPLVPRLRGLSFIHLLYEDIVYDIDGDGDEDLMVPGDGDYLFFLRGEEGFDRLGQIRTRSAEVSLAVGPPALGARLSTTIRIPKLHLEDPERDSNYALRLADGSYFRPGADVDLLSGEYEITSELEDPLARFRRRHGIQATRREGFQSIKQDANGDGFEDYVIVWKNRIWVFLGTKEGVDFERSPNQLLKVSATDQMAAILLPLNGDEKADLVLFKYEIPSLARMVAALAIGLRGEMEVLGYYNDGKPVFARKPNHRATFVFSVPPLLTLMGDIEEIADDFDGILSPLSAASTADFDGDGVLDVMRLHDGHFELYLTRDGRPPLDLGSAGGYAFVAEHGGHELIVDALFGKSRQNLSLESGMRMIQKAVDSMQSSLTAARPPDQRIPVDFDPRRIEEVVTRELNGDRRADIAVFIEPESPNEADQESRMDTQPLRLWMSR